MSAISKASPALLAVAFVFFGLLAPAAAPALEGRGYLELDAGYKAGDFGTPTNSTLFSLSPTLGFVAPRYQVSVTAPLVSIVQETGGTSATEVGVGDVVLRAGALPFPETGGFSASVAAAVKIPTADEGRGLGTGEPDYGGFLGLHQQLGGMKLSLAGGYIVTGDPPGSTLEDVPLVGLGVSKVLGATDFYASLERRGATISGAKDPVEASIGAFHLVNRHYSLLGGITFGLNDGGPALGATLGVVRWLGR
jgi:hypothetical protein